MVSTYITHSNAKLINNNRMPDYSMPKQYLLIELLRGSDDGEGNGRYAAATDDGASRRRKTGKEDMSNCVSVVDQTIIRKNYVVLDTPNER